MNSVWRKIAVLAGGLILAAAGNLMAEPDLRFTEEQWDFGCVGVDFAVRHEFQLVNHGTETIFIDTVTAHCDCSEIRFTDSLVAPGDTARFILIFDTKDFYGPMSKTVRIHSDDAKSRHQQIWYHATIGQWLYSVQPDPVSVFFLPMHKTRMATFINHLLDEVSIDQIETLDDLVSIEPVSSRAGKGERLELLVTPRPDLEAGTFTSNFTITLDVPEKLEPLRITIPVKVVRY